MFVYGHHGVCCSYVAFRYHDLLSELCLKV